MNQQAQIHSNHHLQALLRQNWILWKRNCWGSFCEIMLPAIFVAILFALRAKVDKTWIPEASHLDEKDITFLSPYNPFMTTPPNTITSKFNKTIENSPLIQCEGQTMSDSLARNGYIALAPEGNSIINELELNLRNLNYITKTYTSESEFLNYVVSEGYKEDICFGITIQESSNRAYSYQLHYNTSDYFDDDIPDTLLDETWDIGTEDLKLRFQPWVNSGFLTIQNWIDNIILRSETNDSKAMIVPAITSLKVTGHYSDMLQVYLYGNFAVYTILPLIVIYLRMIYGIVFQKEKKIREGMKIMGLQDSSFYLSWIIYYMVIYLVVAIFVSLELCLTVFPNSDFTLVLVFYYMFCLTLLFQSLFISVFFTRAQIANIVGMVFFLVQYMIENFVNKTTTPYSRQLAASIISHTSTSLSCTLFLQAEAQGKGITWATVNQKLDNYTIGTALLFFFINMLVYCLLFLYLDQVFPNEWGKQRHPLFFIGYPFKKNRQEFQQQNIAMKDIENEEKGFDIGNYEEVDQLLKDKEKNRNAILIKNLKKIYDNGQIAVDNLNLSMYDSQIFVLLGHNGAGKTTTISMLSGFIEITEGKAQIRGQDVATQMPEIRKSLGICPQHDILFDNLTVQEHLELYANFKGMDPSLIPAAVQQGIRDVDLEQKANDLSQNLSGGQKRRLSVAIAFIGDSQVIFLDEPTSGMDTSARRYIWDLLKKYKNDKIVVLTTHFMDEADYLGDRIGIMGAGKLVCSGSSIFLKNKFGVGYYLTIVKQETDSDSTIISNLIKKHVPNAKEVSQVSAEIAYQLPNESVGSFEDLFKELDSNKESLKIQTYGVSITTLEEVFLRVALMQEHKQSNNISLKPDRKMSNEKQEEAENEIEEIDNFELDQVQLQDPFQLFLVHIWALIVKRLISFKRDFMGLFCEIVLPILMIIGGLCILLIQFLEVSPELLLTPQVWQIPVPVLVSGFPKLEQYQSIVDRFSVDDWNFRYYDASSIKDWDDRNYKLSSIDRQGSYFMLGVDYDANRYDYLTQILSLSRDSAPIFINQMNQAIVRSASQKSDLTIKVYNSPLPFPSTFSKLENTNDGIIAALMFSIGLSFIPASLITFLVKEREDKVKHQQLVSGVSITAYWFSNIMVDFCKALVPCLLSIGIVKAFNTDAFCQQTDYFSATALLFFLYAWAIVPFTYFLGFFFDTYGNAQVAGFFLNFIQAILSIIVFILRQIPATKDYGNAIQYILRLIPSFSFANGLINISNIVLLSAVDETKYSTFDIEIAGGDIIYLVFEGFLYFILVFIFEHFSHSARLSMFITKEASIPYTPKKYDVEVVREMQQVAQSNPKDYSIRVNQLRKVYAPERGRFLQAVDRISFGVKNGQCFTFLGVNGAGQTTAFKILCGEILPTSGQAHINGYNVVTEINKVRTYMGYCPQFDALLENLTAREHLEMYAAIKGIPFPLRQGLVKKKLVEMDLSEFENVVAGTYSGGNKRKLSVAIAMLGNPPIVFLDEPSTGMDPKARRFMWSVISRITTKRQKSSVILTTHSMEEAEALSTKMGIMVAGSMKCIGSVQNIKSQYGKGYELEIKIQKPKEEEIIQFLAQQNLPNNVSITIPHLQDMLGKMGELQLEENFKPDTSQNPLIPQIYSQVGCPIITLAEYVVYEKIGLAMLQFIKEKLCQNFEIIQHFQDFYRIKIDANIQIGSVFGILEKEKKNYRIISYSVKQATIQQIFNLFAEDQIPIKDPCDQFANLNADQAY